MMRGYTTVEQSKQLAEILPIESADFFWIIGHLHTDGARYAIIRPRNEVVEVEKYWPCWSLTALLDVLPSSTLDSSDDHHYRVHCRERFTEWHDNAVDACVEMIIKLNQDILQIKLT